MASGDVFELAEEESFCFDCHGKVPCFNKCCRDLNQFLTPYDILRLKNHFGMASYDFLENYTTRHIGPQTGLPVITITPADQFERICPFVSSSGCSVYENRPSSCRMYPLVRVVSRSRKDGEKTIRYALLKEHHCRGFEQERRLTVREWMDSQSLGTYNIYNDLLMDVISMKNQLMPGPLQGQAQQLFYTMCYDIDALKERRTASESGIEDIPDDLKNDEEGLLRFAMGFLKQFFAGKQPG